VTRARSKSIAVLVGAAGAALLGWMLYAPGGNGDGPPVRATPAVPTPTDRERVEYFFSMIARGEQERLDGGLVPVWHVVGFPALHELGEKAVDYLLAEERTAMYRRSPAVVSNVLRLLPTIPASKDHPDYYPFLRSWLAPGALGKHPEAETWRADFRLLVFDAYRQAPHESVVEVAREELSRRRRTHDLRRLAIGVLFAVGRGDVVLEFAPSLPPRPGDPPPGPGEEAPPDLRVHLLTRLADLARETQPPRKRDQARAFVAHLDNALESDRPQDRMLAAQALRRLGPPERSERMRARLVAEYERFRAREGDAAALVFTTALQYLSDDGPDPFVRKQSLALVEEPEPTLGYLTALRLLARHWADEPRILDLLWTAVEEHDFVRFELLAAELVDADRARAARFLEGELRSGSSSRREVALKVIRRLRVTEVVPALLDLVREEPVRSRPPLYAALGDLGADAAVPLLVAELAPNRPAMMHDVAVTELLVLDKRLDVVADAVRAGDPPAISSLRRRALALREHGIPDEVLPAVLDALRTLPNEDDRRELAFALRLRGRLDPPVRTGLVRAYRHEPSRLVARDLRTALVELAHRARE